MRPTPHIACVFVILLAAFTGCKDDSTAVVSHATNPEVVPTMTSTDVETVISEDGQTRYHITAKEWNMFEESKRPHWTFPKGVTCEELDGNFKMVSSIKCDSAYFDKEEALWTLVGNVRMTNVKGDIVLTDKLLWNQRAHKLYSDAFIHIEKQGRIIEGYGYESNESLTTYQLRQVEAIFPIDESRMPHPGSGNTPRPRPDRVVPSPR